MEGTGIIETQRHLSATQEARASFKKELRPVLGVAQKAEIFGRVLREYESGLNSAVFEGKSGKDIRDASWDVMRMQSLKKGSKSSDAQESENLAIRQNAKKVFSFFNEHFGGTTSLLSSYLDGDSEEQNEKLRELIGINLSRFISISTGLGKPFREELQKKEIEEMGKFLLTNSLELGDLRKAVTPTDSISLLEQLNNLHISLQVEKDLLELSDSVKAFALRDWIRTTAREARQGRKIYETPFYKNLLDELHFQSRRKNGVGGVILYGPPGTGKTEILQEKNKQQGFRTRVINVHHYTSFGDLIAEKAIQLGTDQGASMTQKLKTVLDVFGSENADGFASDFKSLFSQLQQERKIGPHESISNFLSSFVSQETIDKLDPNNMSSDDWGKIKAEFISRLKSRMLRTTLGGPYQETLEDIVKGEILLAIKNRQRVVLDELDKAGPNSLGGILSFLAKSPGETFEYGDSTFTIPSWFSVDATSNSTQLNEYLKDRFSDLEVSTPPVKDQLMIAGVRLSDDEGNILLTDYEQRQLVGFFAYMVPDINRILASHNLPPLSNRRIQELTSYLVDFRSLQRTGITFGDAVKKLFEHNKTLFANKETATELDSLLKNSTEILEDKPFDFRKQEASRVDSRLTRGENYSRALGRITKSPLIVAINGLTSEDLGHTSGHSIARVEFNKKQRQAATEWFIAKDSKRGVRADIRQLPIGFTMQEVTDSTGSNLRIMALPEDDSVHILLTRNIPKNGRIAGASEDGTVVLVASDNPSGKDEENLRVFRISDSAKAAEGENMVTQMRKESEIGTDRKVGQMGVLDNRSNSLTIYRTDSVAHRQINSVKRFEISPNGKLLIKEFLNGETELIIIDSLKPLALLSGDSWSFIGDRLIVQKGGQNSIKENGFLIF